MRDTDRVAVLIDCDNISWQLDGAVLAEAAKQGTLGIKRGYGDWSSSHLSGWKRELPLHAIQPMQQPAYIAGKNASDSALIIDAMDGESQRSRDLGCWDGVEFCTPSVDALAEEVGDDWVVPAEFVDAVLVAGLGEDVSPDERSFWLATYQQNYTGDAGRRRLRISTINLRDRDGLHGRLDSVRCPVLWMHGTADQVYSVPNAEDEITRFVNAADAELRVVQGGQHFLSASDPDDVNAATVEFVNRWR